MTSQIVRTEKFTFREISVVMASFFQLGDFLGAVTERSCGKDAYTTT